MIQISWACSSILSQDCRNYVLHHSPGDTYVAYRNSARRFEQQQRLFTELQGGKKIFGVHIDHDPDCSVEVEGSVSDPSSSVCAVAPKGALKCTECGKKGHEAGKCTVDVTKLKCFKCGKFGHISLNCKVKSGDMPKKDSGKGSASASSPPKGSSKGKAGKPGKSSGKGRKGKMFAVFDEDSRTWWYADAEAEVDELGNDESEEQQHEWTAESPVLMLNVVVSEPNTHVSSSLLESSLSLPVDCEHFVLDSGGDDEDATCEDDLVCLYEACDWSEPVQSALLQSLEVSLNDHFWVLDSGASTTVLNERMLQKFSHSPVVPSKMRFVAANGSPVESNGKTQIAVSLRVRDKSGTAAFHLEVVLSNTQYNILSTTQLGRNGWDLFLGDKIIRMTHRSSETCALDTVFWSDTPWVQFFPYHGDGIRFVPEPCLDMSAVGEVQSLNPVVRSRNEEMEVHRARGHVPFDPNCKHCLKAKSTHQHRKRTEGLLSSEITADFCFFNLKGEHVGVVDAADHADSATESAKVLALKESFSSSIGAILMSENVVRDRGILLKWLAEFGLSPGSSSIVLVTDAETSVSSFVDRASDRYNFVVRKAGPQEHQCVAHAERAVRTLKETVKTLQSDFQSLGGSLDFKPEVLQMLLNYVCMSHNNHAKAFGSNKSPREIVASRPLTANPFALFGSRILAEVPESISVLSPNITRFVDAAFLHPQFSSMGTCVFALIRVKEELIPKVFVAKSFKLVFPLTLDFQSGLFVRLRLQGDEKPVPIEEKVDVPRVVPSSKGVSLEAPVSGPPKEFIDRFGGTPGCKACGALELGRSRKGLSHSKACSSRYEQWVRDQISEEAPVLTGGEQADLEYTPEYSPGRSPAVEAYQDFEEIPAVGLAPSERKRSLEGELSCEEQSCAKRQTFVKTRGCPSCESGMNVPGIRHSAVCKRNQALRVAGEIDPSSEEGYMEMQPELRASSSRKRELLVGDEIERLEKRQDVVPGVRLKRSSDTPVEQLEKDIKESVNCLLSESSHDDLQEVVDLAFQLTESEFPTSNLPLVSLKFDHNATSVVIPFGQQKIRIWKPSSAVDDSNLSDLCGDQTHAGMIKEVNSMSSTNVGRLYTWEGVVQLKAKENTVVFRVIPSRWVTVQKTKDTVRARVVIKDLAKGSETARSLGISGPTASSDSLGILVGVAGRRNWFLGAYDVASAFMSTPLKRKNVIIKMPLSVSSISGEPLYMRLDKALNGLRQSSQDWIAYISDIVKQCGLTSDQLEPCLFSGRLPSDEPCMLLVYVDDLLCTCPTKSGLDFM